MTNRINKKDIILGLAMLALSMYILFGNNVIVGNSIFKENVAIGKADFYIKLLAIIMVLATVILILRALNKFGLKNKESPNTPTNYVVILSFAALIIYMFILKPVGFFLASFLLMTFLSFLIRLKEDAVDLKDKKLVIRSLVISCVFSIIAVSVIMYVFTNWLNVILP